jgi:hypothetical protein
MPTLKAAANTRPKLARTGGMLGAIVISTTLIGCGAAHHVTAAQRDQKAATCLRVTLIDSQLGGGPSCYAGIVNKTLKGGQENLDTTCVLQTGNEFTCTAHATGGGVDDPSTFAKDNGNYEVTMDGAHISIQQQG